MLLAYISDTVLKAINAFETICHQEKKEDRDIDLWEFRKQLRFQIRVLRPSEIQM
jgi:hypothetical protein